MWVAARRTEHGEPQQVELRCAQRADGRRVLVQARRRPRLGGVATLASTTLAGVLAALTDVVRRREGGRVGCLEV
jgi:hypothetical protein